MLKPLQSFIWITFIIVTIVLCVPQKYNVDMDLQKDHYM